MFLRDDDNFYISLPNATADGLIHAVAQAVVSLKNDIKDQTLPMRERVNISNSEYTLANFLNWLLMAEYQAPKVQEETPDNADS